MDTSEIAIATKSLHQFLPHGEMLRCFAEQPVIPSADLRGILRRRGVFPAGKDKNSTLPILTASLPSPAEFDALMEAYRSKEASPKVLTRSIPWNSDVNVLDSLPAEILADFNEELEFANYQLVTASEFTPQLGDPNHVKLPFRIERTDTSKSWCQTTNIHDGEVEIRKIEEEGIAKIAITYTANETKTVAATAVKRIVSHLKEQRIVEESDVEARILFSSFTNAERIAFLLGLTVGNSCPTLEFLEISDLAVARDDNSFEPLPEPIAWIEDRIHRFKCRGSSLQQAAFVVAKECHDHFRLHAVDAIFEFNVKGAVGTCRILFEFPKFDQFGGTKSEFQVNIQEVRIKDKLESVPQSTIQRWISLDLQDAVIKQFKHSAAGVT